MLADTQDMKAMLSRATRFHFCGGALTVEPRPPRPVGSTLPLRLTKEVLDGPNWALVHADFYLLGVDGCWRTKAETLLLSLEEALARATAIEACAERWAESYRKHNEAGTAPTLPQGICLLCRLDGCAVSGR